MGRSVALGGFVGSNSVGTLVGTSVGNGDVGPLVTLVGVSVGGKVGLLVSCSWRVGRSVGSVDWNSVGTLVGTSVGNGDVGALVTLVGVSVRSKVGLSVSCS